MCCRCCDVTLPGAHNTSNVLAAVAVGLDLRHRARTPSVARSMDFTGVEHRLEQVADDRRRALRQRLAGHAARRGHRRAAQLRSADRADLRRPQQGPRSARAGRRGRRCAPPRSCSSARRRRTWSASSAAAGARQMVRADDMAHAVRLRRRDRPRRPRTGHDGDRAAQPGGGQLRHVRRLRGARRGIQGRGARRSRRPSDDRARHDRRARRHATARPIAATAAHPSSGDERQARTAGGTADPARSAARAPRARLPAAVQHRRARRDGHPDGLLEHRRQLAAASTIRSAMVGSQVLWGVLGVVAMLVMMRIDYRYLRLISVPAFIVAVALLVLVLLPAIGPIKPQVINDSARWLKIGPLPADAPGRVRQAGARHLPRPLARPARPAGALVRQRDAAVPVHRRSDPGAGDARARPGHDRRPGADRVDDVLRRRRQPAPDGCYSRRSGSPPWSSWSTCSRTSCRASRPSSIPWAVATTRRLSDRPGPAGDGQGRPVRHRASARAASPAHSTCPRRTTTSSSPTSRRSWASSAAIAVICLFLLFAYRGIRVALGAPDTFGALLAVGITGWLVAPGVHQHRRGGRAACPPPASRCRSSRTADRRSW